MRSEGTTSSNLERAIAGWSRGDGEFRAVLDAFRAEILAEVDGKLAGVVQSPFADAIAPPKCPMCGDSLIRAASVVSACINGCTEDHADWRCGSLMHKTLYFSADAKGVYLARYASAFDGEDCILKVKFWIRGPLVEMQVLEQAEELRAPGDEVVTLARVGTRERIASCAEPTLAWLTCFLRGRARGSDNRIVSYTFGDPNEAARRVEQWCALIPQIKLPTKARPEPRVGLRVSWATKDGFKVHHGVISGWLADCLQSPRLNAWLVLPDYARAGVGQLQYIPLPQNWLPEIKENDHA